MDFVDIWSRNLQLKRVMAKYMQREHPKLQTQAFSHNTNM